MATDLGDRVMIDVERFDLDKDQPIFHGLVDLDPTELKEIDKEKWRQVAQQIIGLENMPKRLIESFADQNLDGVPQLGSTGAMAGSLVTYVVRQISCGYDLPSGRYIVDPI